MPEFILNDTPAPKSYDALSAFAKGYVEAMFFTNCDSGDENENKANELGVARLTRASIAAIARDCCQFQTDQRNVLGAVYADCDYSPEQAGRDFWFTRQGHGVGFWDRSELPELERDLLSKGAQGMGETYVEIYRGWIHYN